MTNGSQREDQEPVDRTELFARFGKRPSFSLKERLIRWSLRLTAYLTVAITLCILFVLLKDAIVFFQKADIVEFFTGTVWEPFGEPKKLGVLPLLNGTLMIAFGSSLFAIPLGLGTAVYLTQFASQRVQDIFSPMIEILGGIPTVVYGYFALTSITPLLKKVFPGMDIFNALSASIVVGMGILPMISSLSAEALRLVPNALRDSGYALGMRKFHVVVRIIIPAAASGIVASFILAFSRAVGETMAVTLAAGARPEIGIDYLHSIQTITAFIVQISLGDTPQGSIEYYTIYALGLTLFLITFVFNYLASRIVKRFQEVYQ